MSSILVRSRLSNLARKKLADPRFVQKALSHGYIVLFPEIPPGDYVETDNQLLANTCVKENKLPPFSKFQVDENVLVAAKAVLDFDVWAFDHCDEFKDASKKRSFSTVLEPIEKELSKCECVWAIARQAVTTTKADPAILNEAANVQSALGRARYTIHSNPHLYRAVKEVAADKPNLNRWQKRLVDKYLLEGRLNGADLGAKDLEKLQNARFNLDNHKRSYYAQMAQSYENFDHEIPGRDLEGTPEFALRQLADDPSNPWKGPWRVKLVPSSYWPFMRYCGSRIRRYNAWFAWNTRAGFNESQFNNSINIEEIRTDRWDEAQQFGYKGYSDLSMETKMADSADTVVKFLSTLKSKFKPKFNRRYEELNNFARLNDAVGDPLKPWDLHYYFRKHANSVHSVNENDLSKFFPFSKVLSGLFALAEELFDVKFAEITKNVERLHPDVRVFEVHNGSSIAHLFLDPYARLDKKAAFWLDSGRVKNDISGVTPMVFMNLYLHKEGENGERTVMIWDELKNTVSEFGRALQFLLTESPYSEIAGLNNVEWDAVHCIDFFMEHFLHQPHILQRLSCHIDTGEAFSIHRAKEISSCFVESTFYDMYRNLFLSHFDMAIYADRRPFWLDIYKQLWNEYFPFELDNNDYLPCSFTPIFTQQLSAAYYTNLWSEMLACDMMSAFEAVGFDNMESVVPLARSFKQEIFAVGGGAPYQELFRGFLRRDPSIEPICKFYLNESRK